MEVLPKVSVIIPAYNVSKYIASSIESVLNQGYRNLEIIIVDDGSIDDLQAVLQSYLDDRKIKFIRTENKGVSHAINTGLGMTAGDYVCFLHADDMFLPGKIEKQVSQMARFSRFGISYSNRRYFLEGTNRKVADCYFHFQGDIFYFLKRSNFIHMSTVMLRTKILENIKLDEELTCHEDWDLFLRLSARGVRFLFIDEILSEIRMHPENLSSDTKIMDATRSEVGERARKLWKDFKKGINFYSIRGISNLKRYIMFKTYAAITGFPKRRKFNLKSPREMLYEEVC